MSTAAFDTTKAARQSAVRRFIRKTGRFLESLAPEVMRLPRNAVFIFTDEDQDLRIAHLRQSLRQRDRISPKTTLLHVSPKRVVDMNTGEAYAADPEVLRHIYDARDDDFVAVANAAYAGPGKRLQSVEAIERAIFV